VEKKAHPKMGQKFHGNKILYVFLTAAVLAAFAHPSHIVIYAPGIRSVAALLRQEIR
jgi:hypothetical protein